MKKRRSPASSLELFLDTICNVFGGILFIAICIAIQIQQTEGVRTPKKSPSPQEIADAMQELEQISADIAAAQVLHKTLQVSMPKPNEPAEQARVDLFFELTSAKGDAAAKEAKLLKQLLDLENEQLAQQEKIKQIETVLSEKKTEQQTIEGEIELIQDQNQSSVVSSKELQDEINTLNRQIAQKEKTLKNNDSSKPRNEIVYLPKLRDSGGKRPEYFVLRFNRFYKVSNRNDFVYTGNDLGVPRSNRGIVMDDSTATKTQILSLFQGNVSSRNFLSIFVYGDSADQWYIIRDLLISSGFEYELIPTQDDTPWHFGGGGGNPRVQ